MIIDLHAAYVVLERENIIKVGLFLFSTSNILIAYHSQLQVIHLKMGQTAKLPIIPLTV